MTRTKPNAKRAAPVTVASTVRRLAADGTFASVGEARLLSGVVHGSPRSLLGPQERISLIRHGIEASTIGDLSIRMGMSKESLLSSLGLSRATISRKEKDATVLSKNESERVLGVAKLIEMVQAMVEESGDPTGFDAARWLSEWLSTPLPALAGATPASYMDTFEGQRLVADLLSMSQSGAYA